MKYIDTQITFREVPDMVCRCFSISNCGERCKNCHSPELRKDIGTELTDEILLSYLTDDKNTIDCFVFLGDGGDNIRMCDILKLCKEHGYKTCIYLGRNTISMTYLRYLDYVKLGPYIEELGGLDNQNTNQIMFEIKNINNKFQK